MKHWVLFIFIILPLVAQIVVFTTVAAAIMGEPETGEEFGMIILSMGIVMLTAIISMFFSFGWLYAVGTQLYPRLPEGHTLKLGRFKFTFFYMIVSFLIFFGAMVAMIAYESPTMIFTIFPFHFLAMLCVFYNWRFVAKSLKTFELKRNARFGDYAGEFFLLWFFFIGVWIIQPRINNIFESRENEYGGPVDRYMK